MVEGKASEPLAPSTVTGLKYLRRIFDLLQGLNASGTAGDKAGNRELLFGHYAGLVLLGMFNPTLQSLRGLSAASGLKRVQKTLGSSSASLGSLSESVRVFDPALLEPLFQELCVEVQKQSAGPGPRGHDDLARRLTAVDGTVLKILPQLVAAAGSPGSRWRMHLQFDVGLSAPVQAKLTANGGGDNDERSVLRDTLQAERTYVMDAGYERYALFQQIVDAKSDYVCRVQQRPVTVVETRELTDAARAAGVVSDEIVDLGCSRSDVAHVTHRVRRVIFRGVALPEKPRRDRQRSEDVVLLTNLTDVPAEVVGVVFRQRWPIELFFRFFKQVLRCKNLLSTKDEGVAIQVYCALIAALLLSLVTGRNHGRRGFELLCLFLQGWADEEDVQAGLKRLATPQRKKG